MKLVLAMMLAALAGTATAWWVVDQKYGQYEAYLGVIDREGQITAEQIEQVVNLAPATAFAEIELPDGSEHDFGVMQPDEKGEHQFRIRNVGTAPLTLRLGTTTCKCTLGDLEDDQLNPGEETTVRMEWTVKTSANRFSQSAELRTNDPEHPAVQLKIQGQVVRGVEIVPGSWAFGDIAAGEPIEMSAQVYNHLQQDIQPTELRFSGSFMRERAEIDVEAFIPSEQDGVHANARQGFRISARIPPGMPQGAVEGTFTFAYELLDEQGEVVETQESNVVTATVSGRVVGVLGMIPSSRLKEVRDGTYLLDLGRLESESDLEAQALVVVKGSERDEIRLRVGAVEPEGVMEVSLGEPTVRASTALYRLNVRFQPGEQSVEMLGKAQEDIGQIMIEAENADVPPMRLLVRFALPKR